MLVFISVNVPGNVMCYVSIYSLVVLVTGIRSCIKVLSLSGLVFIYWVVY